MHRMMTLAGAALFAAAVSPAAALPFDPPNAASLVEQSRGYGGLDRPRPRRDKSGRIIRGVHGGAPPGR